jgi:hypothetical protein
MERGEGPVPGEEKIRNMAIILGQDPDALLALADKVAADVLAVIIKQPAYARFLRENKHLPKAQLDTVSKMMSHCAKSR